MKKKIAALGLGALLVTGLFFAQDNNQSDLAVEPSVFSIGKPIFDF